MFSARGQRATSFSKETLDRFTDTRRGQGWGQLAGVGGRAAPSRASQDHKATNWLGFFSETDKGVENPKDAPTPPPAPQRAWGTHRLPSLAVVSFVTGGTILTLWGQVPSPSWVAHESVH